MAATYLVEVRTSDGQKHDYRSKDDISDGQCDALHDGYHIVFTDAQDGDDNWNTIVSLLGIHGHKLYSVPSGKALVFLTATNFSAVEAKYQWFDGNGNSGTDDHFEARSVFSTDRDDNKDRSMDWNIQSGRYVELIQTL